MPRLSLIRPLDQPPDRRRILEDLKSSLVDKRLSSFKLIVAYAKSGPLLRLQEHFASWRALGKQAEAILGIDQQGTSREALSLARTMFDSVYVTQALGITFHPKIYLFIGDNFARALIGSNNLTVGGTEKNFEAAVNIELDLPKDADILAELETCWTELLPPLCPVTRLLTSELLELLVADGFVLPEMSMRSNAGADAMLGRTRRGIPPEFRIVPESPLPKKPASRPTTPAGQMPAGGLGSSETVRGFAIQIKPHHNGEIFLSRTATTQNPAFFGWPFTGQTTPKKATNRPYPQREPDPIVNITVFGRAQAPILTLASYALNTVFYAPKSEIRVTASPLVGVVPDYSVMIMEPSTAPDTAYEITVYTPASPDYSSWVAACNQTMPSGGSTPRKFGWF